MSLYNAGYCYGISLFSRRRELRCRVFPPFRFFALGRSILLLLAGTFTGFIKNPGFMQRWGDMIQKVSGLVLIGLGLYFLWTISV